jgi:hypothetical protein
LCESFAWRMQQMGSGIAGRTKGFAVGPATRGVLIGIQAELILSGLERVLLIHGIADAGRRIGIEKRSERVRMTPIDEAGDEKLVLKSIGMARTAQEREESADFGVRMNYNAIIAIDRGNDQSAKSATIAQGGGIDGIEQLHMQHGAFRQHAQNVRSRSFHASLQLEIHNRAGRNLQRRDVRKRRQIPGLSSGGKRGQGDGAYK